MWQNLWSLSQDLFPVILFWGMLFVLIFVLLRALARLFRGQEDEDPALTILRKRFARGEIDQQEFDRKASAIDKSHSM